MAANDVNEIFLMAPQKSLVVIGGGGGLGGWFEIFYYYFILGNWYKKKAENEDLIKEVSMCSNFIREV